MTQIEALKKIEEEAGIRFPKVLQIGRETWGYSLNTEGDVTGIGLPSLNIPKTHILTYLKFFPKLSVLNLSVNNLTDIKPLEELNSLTELDLHTNKISDISPLEKLTSLSTLSLSHNTVENIESLTMLTKLEWLDLNFNKLKKINRLKTLTNLKKLYLRRNIIISIEALSDMTDLTLLDIRENEITNLEPISKLTKLSDLDIRDNKIEYINVILNFKNLIRLELRNNPLLDIPPEIANRGLSAIKSWFGNTDEKIFVNEVKVILVGFGAVGKTTLVKCLKKQKPNPNEPATHHINITTHKVTYNESEIKLNFWDFGGQEIMYSLHQFFMSKRSVYILVLDGRTDDKHPEYWLNMIKSLGGNSPVLVVLNKKDMNPTFDVDRRFLQTKYPFILSFYETSCSEPILGIEMLEKGLVASLEKVPILGTLWRKDWLKVKNKLIALTEHFISQQDYDKLCAQHDILDEDDKEGLADFLNDLGIIVHFRERSLASMHILNPQWAARAAYKIISSPIVALAKGRFKLSDLRKIMKKDESDIFEYPVSTHEFIVNLMQKFELCYKLFHNDVYRDDSEYLLPELLNKQQPSLPKQKGEVLKFYFFYKDILPTSIFPRFIVRMHEDIYEDESGNKLQWHTGVVIYIKQLSSVAIVVADVESRKIDITVSGSRTNRIAHFGIIRKTFNSLHQTFEKLNVTEWIPLPGEPDYAVEYGELLGHEKFGREEYFHGKLEKLYKVKDLLDGIESESHRRNNVNQMGYKWDVFICHSSLDKPKIEKIIDDLKSKGISYWYDSDQIKTGDSIISKISEGLENSRSIMPCISANQLASSWSRNEYQIILYKMISNISNQRICTLILDETIHDDIPTFLAHRQYRRYGIINDYNKLLMDLQIN